MDPQQQLQLKTVHINFLSMPETKALKHNISKMGSAAIERAMAESTLGNLDDTQIRCLIAEARGIKSVLQLMEKYESIIIA